jgi:hypothetical protein
MIDLFRIQDPEPDWDLVQKRIIGSRAKVRSDLKDKLVLALLKLRSNQERFICPSIRIGCNRFQKKTFTLLPAPYADRDAGGGSPFGGV